MTNASEKYIDAIRYLGDLYDFWNEKYYGGELIKPVITIQADAKNKATGWFVCGEVWHESAEEAGSVELNISAQFLNRPAADIAETMLHELAHQYAHINKMQDCSRGGSYHNKLFARIAETHGLTVEKDSRIGWAVTKLSPAAAELFAGFSSEHKLIYRDPDKRGMKVKSSSTRKYICPICGTSVRATKRVAIMCAECMELMYEEE